MFRYVDLIWTALATIGGFLLLSGHEKDLNKTNWWGVIVIFVGFLFQGYWEFIVAKDWISVAGVSLIVLSGMAGMLLRKMKSAKAV